MSADWRVARRDSALDRAAALDELADQGGTALYYPDDLRRQADKSRRFAEWVDRKITAR